MRSHSALYMDAGYLIAAAATRLTGSSFRRGVVVDYAHMLADLINGHSVMNFDDEENHADIRGKRSR